jgi:hypothetical protein
MKYAVEMGSGAVIYIPNFINIGSGIQKLIGGTHIQTHRRRGDHISLLLFFQSNESFIILEEIRGCGLDYLSLSKPRCQYFGICTSGFEC